MPPKEKVKEKEGPKEDFSLKETSPNIDGKRAISATNKLSLVEQRQFLYVRVVKAHSLPVNNDTGNCDPFIEMRIGNYKGETNQLLEKTTNPEWNQVFAFSKDQLHGGRLDIMVRDKESLNDEIIGRVSFELGDIPTRFPDSPLAPRWYSLKNRNKDRVAGELMLAVWIGNQADDAFSVAWHSDAVGVCCDTVKVTRSKVYLSPKLWYLRIHVIGAQDVLPTDKNRQPEVYVKAVLGDISVRTHFSLNKSVNPFWNEELMLVAGEPFDDPLVLCVENNIGPKNDECLGFSVIPLHRVEKRLLPSDVGDHWINLERLVTEGKEKKPEFAGRLHLRLYLDGVYHVFDESTSNSSDFRATSTMLETKKIGILELGIMKAEGLPPIKSRNGRATTDAYCVAKYGEKWVRTRTIVDSFAPKWNEQHYWEVYDPYTVITIGVFDNSMLLGGKENGGTKDPRIGKVRIRLSTLETGKIYTHSYPLIVLQPGGLKKMGELHLNVKFTCLSWSNLLRTYGLPLLPAMHYINPLSINQLVMLRKQAIHVLCLKLDRADPPLREEVVEYMLDSGDNNWSLRKGKANWERVLVCLTGIVAVWSWFHQICQWKNPVTSVLVCVLFLIMVFLPKVILPLFFMSFFVVGVLHYPKRPRHPPHMDTRLSHAEYTVADELDEEFDSFPTSKTGDALKIRYDRLRRIGGNLVMMVGDLVNQVERVHALVSWRDPRATFMFLIFCLIAGVVLYLIPFRCLVLLIGTYVMSPWKVCPSLPQNFLRRLPAKADVMF